jgi:hypothetical protein
MEDLILKNAQIALEKHSDFRSKILGQAEQAIRIFCKDDISKQFNDYLNRHLSSAERVLKTFEDKDLAIFDLFRLAGFFAKEENFSNAVASIIDPNKSHNLGKRTLESILVKIKHRDKKDKISSILNAISTSEYIHVRRELHLGSTIPDIVVESDKFIIFIENKIRKGTETITQNGNQTFRQKCALYNRGKHLPDECLLGIFLSPEGKPPADNDFVRLSVSEFVEAIEELLDPELTDTNISIKAFLHFYKLS